MTMTVKKTFYCLWVISHMLIYIKCQEISENKLQLAKSCEKESFEKFQVLKVQISEEKSRWKIFKDLQSGQFNIFYHIFFSGNVFFWKEATLNCFKKDFVENLKV